MAKRREPPATALARYARLEAVGDWWDGETARPREVIVKFGRSSLTLYGFDETPLAHWALAGLRRIDAPGEPGTLRLTPDVDGDERLVLRDPEMIEAIRAVCPDLDRAAPSNGSWRRVALWAAGALTSIALLVFVIVPALAERLAPMIPPERAAARSGGIIGANRSARAGTITKTSSAIEVSAPAAQSATRRQLPFEGAALSRSGHTARIASIISGSRSTSRSSPSTSGVRRSVPGSPGASIRRRPASAQCASGVSSNP